MGLKKRKFDGEKYINVYKNILKIKKKDNLIYNNLFILGGKTWG